MILSALSYECWLVNTRQRKDMIIKELEQLEGKDDININQQNVWSPILMKRRKATIHHALAPFNEAELNQKLARSGNKKPLCAWIKANPIPSPKQNPKNRLTSQKNEKQSTISLFNIIYQRTEENTTVKTAKIFFEITKNLDDDVDEINEINETVCTFAQQLLQADNKIDAPPSTSNSLMHPKTGDTQSNTTTRGKWHIQTAHYLRAKKEPVGDSLSQQAHSTERAHKKQPRKIRQRGGIRES